MEEYLQLAYELIAVFGGNDIEFKSIEQMRNIVESWEANRVAVDDEIGGTIQALSADFDDERTKIAALDSAISEELKKVSDELSESQSFNSALAQRVTELRKKLEEARQNYENLTQQRRKKTEENSQDLTSLRNKVNLYSHVAKIRWDYTTAEEDIKGYIANNNKVTPFQLSTQQNSRYFIANHIWDLMDP